MYLVVGGRGLAGCGHLLVSVLGLLLLLTRSGTRALVYLPCDESKCEEPRSCLGSIVQGICGCCYMCARQRKESCGGAFGLHGVCDWGLRCVIRPRSMATPSPSTKWARQLRAPSHLARAAPLALAELNKVWLRLPRREGSAGGLQPPPREDARCPGSAPFPSLRLASCG
ncbi:Hypothetical predicted protein [Marmota monax]|uniref:IGFBP N-terminal domain-containing protein n=1 Tax=Marmota monax TaxID=9995 RepID=A0A5E4CWN5_MARMO|nr:hypothetical protein GHT09_017983 [Marmota monax]VTJ86264.1 Hypothetical predicted protein [Marmota monax]